MGTLPAKQELELLTGRPLSVPKGPIEGGERCTESVLLLMYLLRKA